MKQLKVKVAFLKKLKTDIYLLAFKSFYIAAKAKPGQFLHIKVDEKVTILRRPLSIHRINADTVYLLFRVRGRGTKLLSQYKPGDTLDVIGPLGNGFNYVPFGEAPLHSALPRPLRGGSAALRTPTSHGTRILVAGGMGVAPLVFLAQILKQTTNYKLQTTVLLGAKNKRDVLAEQEFRKLGCKVLVATDDGSRGFKGSVADLLKKSLTTYNLQLKTDIYACGPKEMFAEIAKVIKPYKHINCQISFEQFMGCGLGVCCGCTIETKSGYKKVCKDGPVFDINNIK